MRRLLFRSVESVHTSSAYNAIGSRLYGQKGAPANSTATPSVNAAGSRCTVLGIRDIFVEVDAGDAGVVHLLEEFLQVRPPFMIHPCSGKSLHAYPPLKMRILKSMSSPKRIREKPPSVS